MTEFLSLIHHYKICIWEMSVSYFDCTNYYFDIGRSDMGLLIHKRRCFTRTAFCISYSILRIRCFLFHSFSSKECYYSDSTCCQKNCQISCDICAVSCDNRCAANVSAISARCRIRLRLRNKTFISCFQSRFRRIHIILCRIRICKDLFCFCTGFIKCRPAFCCVPVRFNVFIRFIKILQSAYICSARVWIRCRVWIRLRFLFLE